MAQRIRAVYEDGKLRLLDTVDLREGQHVWITIVPGGDAVRAALEDLIGGGERHQPKQRSKRTTDLLEVIVERDDEPADE